MQDSSFECQYAVSKIRIAIENGKIKIKQPVLSEIVIEQNDLVKIEFETLSNPVPIAGWCFYLKFTYLKNGEPKTKKIVLEYDASVNIDCVEFLKKNFPEKSFIGPNETEKETVLSQGYKKSYRIHAMRSLVVILAFFLIAVTTGIILFVVPGSEAKTSGGGTSSIIGTIFILISLSLLFGSLLIMFKKRMVIETNNQGMKITKLIKKFFVHWEDFTLGEPNFRVTKFYGNYSAHSDAFFIVPVIRSNGRKFYLKMTTNQAGKLFRELYYRGKTDLETAKKVSAFF